jgi:hypothetical protein
MLKGRQKAISDYAEHVLGDGEDIHITESFEEQEENSSTIANASCGGEQSIVLPRNFSRRQHARETIHINKLKSVGNERDKDIDPNGKQAKVTSTSTAEKVINDPDNDNVVRKPLQAINRIINSIRDRNPLVPWRLRQPNVAVCRPPTLKFSIREYHKILEEDEEATQVVDSITVTSLRSSRNNIRTGKSMLVRQNAEVFGKPSVAQAMWDISSSLSSAGSSGNSKTILHKQKSVSLDNASCSGLSDITEDTTFTRIKKIDNSFIRRQVVFVNPADARLGGTFCIEEAEESGSDEGDDSPHSHDGEQYDFRQLELQNTKIDSASPWNMIAASGVDTDCDLYSPRQRIFSDSDILFEHRWRDIHRNISDSSNSNGSKDVSLTENSSKKLDRNITVSNPFNRNSLDSAEIGKPTGVQRNRTHSDSYLSEILRYNFTETLPWENIIGHQSEHAIGSFTGASDGFPLQVDARDDTSSPRTRAFSDSFREAPEGGFEQRSMAQTYSLETQQKEMFIAEDCSAFASHQYQGSSLLSTLHPPLDVTKDQSSTLFENDGPNCFKYPVVELGSNVAHVPIQAPFHHMSSPTSLRAADDVVVLPAGPTQQPILVSSRLPGTSKSIEYYWGKGSVEDEGLWPSVSSDDTFEDIF